MRFLTAVFVTVGILLPSFESSEIRPITAYNVKNYCKENVCKNLNLPELATEEYYLLAANPEVTTLEFKTSKIPRIPPSLFEVYPNLQELNLSNSSVLDVRQTHFEYADKLQILNMADNFLTEIRNETFVFVENLEYLWLDRNQIENLEALSFQGLQKLRVLSMENNMLESLPENIFSDLTNLGILNLKVNRIQTLPMGIFKNNLKLYGIQMNHNDLKEVRFSAFAQLETIDLLDLSHNPNLKELTIELNLVGEINADFSGIEVLNIYGTFRSGCFRNNKIVEVYFENPQHIEILELRNNSLKDLQTLAGLAEKLEYLDLSVNPLGKVQSSHFGGMKSLRSLNLSSTDLVELPYSFFENSPVQTLDISNNKIEIFNLTLCNNLKNLTTFYIDRNNWNCYNLKLVMQLFVNPRNIYYSIDRYDGNFPGEFLYGIACLYRLEETNNEVENKMERLELDEQLVEFHENESRKNDRVAALEAEIQSVRAELKAVVLFYESKFSVMFERLQKLEEKGNKTDQET